MAAYLPAGIVIVLLLGMGWLLIRGSRSDQTGLQHRMVRWGGFALIFMAVMLILYGILQYLEGTSHHLGH